MKKRIKGGPKKFFLLSTVLLLFLLGGSVGGLVAYRSYSAVYQKDTSLA